MALLLAAVFALGGCGTSPESPPRAAESESRGERAAERLTGDSPADEAPPPPESLTAALRDAAVSAPLASRDRLFDDLAEQEPRFDLHADEVPARAFFQGLVADTPYNIVIHPDIEGTISLRLHDVSIPEVMEKVRDVYGYEFRHSETGYVVYSPRLETRLFRLDFLHVERQGRSGIQVSAGTLASDNDALAGSSLSTESRSSLWRDLEELLSRLVDDQGTDGGRVTVSPEAGIVAVRATPVVLRQVEGFLEELQGALQRQVVLEARILEVELEDGFERGIEWERVGDSLRSALLPGTGTREVADNAYRLRLERDGSFNAIIRALERQGSVQVLSAPRISTLNHQKAVIKVGTDEFFQTDVSISRSSSVDGGERFVDIIPDFEPFFSGIALDVTPAIDRNGWVTLHVQPSVTTVRDVPRTIETHGQRSEFALARSDVRQADTIVRARDSEIVIIGGLIEEREEQTTSRFPLLGRIPLLGQLFTRERSHSKKYELVILLRPHFVGDETWGRELEQQDERLRRFFDP
ncbi:type II secretion system protein GspD [Halorhodospira abdelmalekii]|uniref:type II secretion system protein GspD n=1 Tax=Halorhodospira abdelmalekii TaxID=421629 RepID=UPI001F5B663B|nr:MSHA type pilus biogenesis protein MshL [Halorhodospira abdelmalekii]